MTGEHVLVGGPGSVTAYRKDTGEQVWTQAVNGDPRGLAAADGQLLVSTDAGVIACFASEGAKPPASDDSAAATANAGTEPLMAQAADEILARTGVTARVLSRPRHGAGRPRRANSLERSELRIYCVEQDPAKVQQARSPAGCRRAVRASRRGPSVGRRPDSVLRLLREPDRF